MQPIRVLDAPSVLGLRQSGVEALPKALRAAGLVARLHAEDAGVVVPPPYDPVRDPATGVLNAAGIVTFSRELATRIGDLLDRKMFPLVLGGDCSIVIGAMLALRRRDRSGLVFIDGHADFYSPATSTTGEVADMDLAIVAGQGPDALTDLEGLRPLVRPEDIALIGYRDAEEAAGYGSPDVRDAGIAAWDLATLRRLGAGSVTAAALSVVTGPESAGYWVHLDVDVLNDAVMPAVDYRMPGGLTFAELEEVLAAVLGGATGISVAIFNPRLDQEGEGARRLVQMLGSAFARAGTPPR